MGSPIVMALFLVALFMITFATKRSKLECKSTALYLYSAHSFEMTIITKYIINKFTQGTQLVHLTPLQGSKKRESVQSSSKAVKLLPLCEH